MLELNVRLAQLSAQARADAPLAYSSVDVVTLLIFRPALRNQCGIDRPAFA
jgi:hypothetical protein